MGKKNFFQKCLDWLCFLGRASTCRICWRVAIAVFASILVSVSVILIPTFKVHENNQLQQLSNTGLTAFQAYILMNKFDPQTTRPEFIDAAFIAGFKIYSEEQKLLKSHGSVPSSELKNGVKPKLVNNALYVIYSPDELKAPYWINAKINATNLEKSSLSFIYHLAFVVLIIAAIATLATLIIVGLWVINPLLKLRKQLLNAASDPNHPEKYKLIFENKNEMGDVITSFNKMLDLNNENLNILREQEEKLNQLNKFLEHEVEIDTQKIQQQDVQLKIEVKSRLEAEEEVESIAYFVSENPSPVLRFSDNGDLIYYNKPSQCLIDLIGEENENSVFTDWKRLISSVYNSGTSKELEVECRDRTYLLNFVPIKQRNYINVYGTDITVRKERELEITHMQTHDHLTGMPNSILFDDILKAEISWSQENNLLVSVFSVTIPEFSSINNTLGHLYSNELVKRVANKIRDLVPESATCAKASENEFLIAIGGLEDAADVDDFVLRLLGELNGIYTIIDHNIKVNIKIGIAINPIDTSKTELLIKFANLAMYYATQDPVNNYKFYKEEMNTSMEARHKMLSELHLALEKNEFVIRYQPQLNLHTGKLCGFEALLRWKHPEFGLVSPNEFIHLIEESELIIPIGTWLMRSAILQSLIWQKQFNTPITASVNLSTIQFRQPDLVSSIKDILSELNNDPNLFEIEITESAFMDDIQHSISILKQLDELGIRLAVDDFGTGYSSLSYIKSLPIDKLKIDQSFVHDIHEDIGSRAITETIIDLAHNLHLTVIAEGVSTEEQLEILYHQGCDQIQGFYISEPLDTENFADIFASWQAKTPD